MDLSIVSDPLIQIERGRSYPTRNLIPHVIYKFHIKSDEFSKEKHKIGLKLPKPAHASFQNPWAGLNSKGGGC